MKLRGKILLAILSSIKEILHYLTRRCSFTLILINILVCLLRIMVLDKGFVVEFDTPLNLLVQKGIFYSMAQEAGIV